MNMQLHGVQNPAITYRDSLAQDHAGDIEAYSLVLANPPFAGSLDYESTAKDRCTRRCPAACARRTAATARRVVRSEPVKPIATNLSWATSARTLP